MADFMLPVQYLRQIAEQLYSLGVTPDDWLARHGLNMTRLAEAGFQPDLPTFCRLLDDARDLSNEPALGLLIGARLVANTHGILGFAALQSATLRQALQLIQRYLALRTTLFELEQVADAATSSEHLRFNACFALGSSERTLQEAVMLAVKNVFEAISPGQIRLLQVQFTGADPDYAALAAELFGCPVAYGQPWTGFTLDAALFDVPLKLADPDAFREAEQICQRELAKLEEKTSMSARVRRLMLEKQQGFPSLTLTARLFHLTPRTLHRRLLAENTSFKQILEDVRHTLAVAHLKAGHLTVEEVAYSLGYTDLANFRRAFKRWEGVPPSRLRPSPAPATDGAKRSIPR